MNYSNYNLNIYNTIPKINLYEDDDMIDEDIMRKKKVEQKDNARLGTKGVFSNLCDKIDNELALIFFSKENIKRIQKMIKEEIYIKTNKQFKLDEDQDENDLMTVLRNVYTEHARFNPKNIIHQVKILNKHVINYVTPDMISQLKQYYSYIKEINQPIKPIFRPMNVNNAGRRTTPSLTTTFGF
jgi:hypothetical protein